MRARQRGMWFWGCLHRFPHIFDIDISKRRRRNTSHQFRDVSMSSECQKTSSQNKIREGFFLLRNQPKNYINTKSSPLKTQRSRKSWKKSWSRTPGSGGRPPGFNTRTPTVYAWRRVDLVWPRAHRCNWGSPHKWPKLNGQLGLFHPILVGNPRVQCHVFSKK